MADLLELSKWRPIVRPQAQSERAVSAPCDSEASELKQVHRASARAGLESRLAFIQDKLSLLTDKHGFSVQGFRDALSSHQSLIDEFHRLIPPAINPYSPRMSDSMAMLTETQYNLVNELMGKLGELMQQLHHAEEHAAQLNMLRQSMNTIRNQVKPRNLRQTDWDDPDLGLCAVIDCAANALEQLARFDELIAGAKTAMEEQRWPDAYNLNDEASHIFAYLTVAENALTAGALEELESEDQEIRDD